MTAYDEARAHTDETIALCQRLPSLMADPDSPECVAALQRLRELAHIAVEGIQYQSAWLKGWQAAKAYYGIR